jgi:hypothetical protein
MVCDQLHVSPGRAFPVHIEAKTMKWEQEILTVHFAKMGFSKLGTKYLFVSYKEKRYRESDCEADTRV